MNTKVKRTADSAVTPKPSRTKSDAPKAKAAKAASAARLPAKKPEKAAPAASAKPKPAAAKSPKPKNAIPAPKAKAAPSKAPKPKAAKPSPATRKSSAPLAVDTQLQVLRAETAYLRQRLSDAEEQLTRLKSTVSFRLGETLMQTRSFGDLMQLPGRLSDLRNASNEKRRKSKEARAKALPGELEAARERRSQAASRAAALTAKAKGLRQTDLAQAITLGEEAVELEPKGYRLKWLASLMYDAGMVDRPAALMERAWEVGETFTPDQNARLEMLRGMIRIRREGLHLPTRAAATAWAPNPHTVAYVAASSLPHHISGYTLRTHDLIRAIGAKGWTVEAFTRAGYPWDRRDAVRVKADTLAYAVDDVTYTRLEGPGSNRTAFDLYVEAAAASLTNALKERRPAVVHAASNYVNALPALIAARRAGLPFVYEVRGLWELTAAQRTVTGEANERFEQTRDLEIMVAREADSVLAINESLKQELVRRGVPAERIAIAPNSVDVERFQPIERDDELKDMLGLGDRFVAGFIGSVVDYEGLDDAVDALALLERGGVKAALLVVGGGAAEEAVAARARERGLEDLVVMTGRVGPDVVPRYYSIIDVAVFPRKPSAVTETVSPLKPLEAMAMGKPVVASNVAALAEMVADGETGLLFQKGDTAALASTIARISRDPELAAQLGANGRRFVESQRTWGSTASRVIEAYEALTPKNG
jgi:PEP-CTERM/exosortase A-associated glycosyltransferase